MRFRLGLLAFCLIAPLHGDTWPCVPATSSCSIAADDGITATGSFSGGNLQYIPPTSLDSVLGNGPWDDVPGLAEYEVIAVTGVSAQLLVSGNALDNMLAGATLTGDLSLPSGKWMVTPYGLNWNPSFGGDPSYADAILSSTGGGGAEFFYADMGSIAFMEGGTVTVTLSTAITGSDTQTGIGFNETILDLVPVPEPSSMTLTATPIVAVSALLLLKARSGSEHGAGGSGGSAAVGLRATASLVSANTGELIVRV